MALDHAGPGRAVPHRQRGRFPARCRRIGPGGPVHAGRRRDRLPAHARFQRQAVLPRDQSRLDRPAEARPRGHPAQGRKDPSISGKRASASSRAGARRPKRSRGAVDWSAVEGETLSFKFRQDPGPQNSLGRIKFMFPNKFDVYLHDTPERWLFGRAERDSARAASGSSVPSISRLIFSARSGLDQGEDPRNDRKRSDPGGRPAGAAERPSPLLDNLAGQGRPDPVPQRHLPQGRGPRPRVGGEGVDVAEVGPVTRSGRGRRRRGRSSIRLHPDPTAAKIDRRLVELPQLKAGDADVDGLTEEMEALLAAPRAVRPEKLFVLGDR